MSVLITLYVSVGDDGVTPAVTVQNHNYWASEGRPPGQPDTIPVMWDAARVMERVLGFAEALERKNESKEAAA